MLRPEAAGESFGGTHAMGSLLYSLGIGLVAGWAAGKIMGGGGYGTIMDIILGIVGGFIGSFVIGLMGMSATSLIPRIITAIIGAGILVGITRLIKKEV
jgi:uncharacterized membrane protein YeaQ/YmgE (transglycosylase-associated protein family)